MKELRITSKKHEEMIDITTFIQRFIDKEHVQEGYVHLYIPPTTAALTINEGADPSVQRDIISALEKLIPDDGSYHHAEGNSAAHIKASLFGCSLTIPISDNQLMLGTWQHIFCYEGDGPRQRTIYVQILAEKTQ